MLSPHGGRSTVDKMLQTNLLTWVRSQMTAGRLFLLWTGVKTANRATQFINAIHEAVAQRNEAEQAGVWNTITVFMALSALLSRLAGGDGIHPSAMKRAAWAEWWRTRFTDPPPLLLQTSSSSSSSSTSLVSPCVYLGLLICVAYVMLLTHWVQAWRSRHTLQQDTSGWWQWRQVWNEAGDVHMTAGFQV